MWDRCTHRAKRALNYARDSAISLGSEYIGTEHILIGLCSEPYAVAGHALEKLGVDLDELSTKIEEGCRRDGVTDADNVIALTPMAERVHLDALEKARRLNDDYLGTEHILFALTKNREGTAAKELQTMDIDHERVVQELSRIMGGQWHGAK